MMNNEDVRVGMSVRLSACAPQNQVGTVLKRSSSTVFPWTVRLPWGDVNYAAHEMTALAREDEAMDALNVMETDA